MVICGGGEGVMCEWWDHLCVCVGGGGGGDGVITYFILWHLIFKFFPLGNMN